MSGSTADRSGKRREALRARFKRDLRHAFLHNAPLKFVALILAVTLFILVNTSKVITVEVGVSYTMPENQVLVSNPVDQVRVTIKGSWRRIKRFDERELDRVHADLRHVPGNEYSFSEESIRLPSGLSVLSIEPRVMQLRFEPAVERTVRVSVSTSGQPASGYKVASIVAKPSQITVRGAESAIAVLDTVPTRELDLSGKSASFTEVLPLVPPRPSPVIQLIDSKSAEVEVTISEEMSTRRIEGIDVQIRPGPRFSGPVADRFELEPARVDVVLHGPHWTVESFSNDIVAYIEVHPDDTSGRAPRQAAVQVAAPPEGMGIEVVPRTVTVHAIRALTPPE
jgi:hypothetical protein